MAIDCLATANIVAIRGIATHIFSYDSSYGNRNNFVEIDYIAMIHVWWQ
jgi:hypothetical protein